MWTFRNMGERLQQENINISRKAKGPQERKIDIKMRYIRFSRFSEIRHSTLKTGAIIEGVSFQN